MRNLVLLGAAIFLAGIFWGCGGGGGSTPQTAKVTGLIVMPLQVRDPVFEVYLDKDLDPTNGATMQAAGICQCNNNIDYFFQDAPPDTYFLYAIVRKTNSAPGTMPVVGDYVGYFNGDNNPPTAPFTGPPSAANAIVPATGSADFMIYMHEKTTP